MSGVDKGHHDIAGAPSRGQPLVVVGEAAGVQEPPALPRGRDYAVITQEATATSLQEDRGSEADSERTGRRGSGRSSGGVRGRHGGLEGWHTREAREGQAHSPEEAQEMAPAKELDRGRGQAAGRMGDRRGCGGRRGWGAGQQGPWGSRERVHMCGGACWGPDAGGR